MTHNDSHRYAQDDGELVRSQVVGSMSVSLVYLRRGKQKPGATTC